MGQKSLFAIAHLSILLAKLVMFSQIVEIVQLIDMHYLVVYIVRELERKRSSIPVRNTLCRAKGWFQLEISAMTPVLVRSNFLDFRGQSTIKLFPLPLLADMSEIKLNLFLISQTNISICILHLSKILQCKMLDLVKQSGSPPTYEKKSWLTMI